MTGSRYVFYFTQLENFLFDHAKKSGMNINWNYHLKDIFYAEVKVSFT